ncbi:hypothetical protein N752_25825 [Desulforamulus aquiferis]|nr:substrate-binding domain-containing protein [Desulforamulus aquiferis]RYD02234.1 hypothetical protein N752_25825 [Desulforamulus aquiferis]
MVKQNEGKISVLKIDEVEPTTENIASGEYKIARPLLLVTKEQPDEKQQIFIDYLLSEKGLTVVEELGFIPPAK